MTSETGSAHHVDPRATVSVDVAERLSIDAERIARDAAGTLLDGYRSRPRATEKDVKDLVTEYDRRSQDRVIALLEEAYPGVPIIAEESADEVTIPEGLAFVVDPLDGTTNFVHGHPFFAVAVGAMFSGTPVAGAVFAPVLRTAWRGMNVGPRPIAQRDGAPCSVSGARVPRECLVGTGFPPERGPSPWNNFASFMSVKRAVRGVRRCGAAAIDICFVADGTYDAYWERRLLLWDAIAAAAVALAAGATITAIDGSAPVYEKGHIVVATPAIHAALVDLVNAPDVPVDLR